MCVSNTGKINNVHRHIHSFIVARVLWLLGIVQCRVVARGGEAGLRDTGSLSALTQKLKSGQEASSGDNMQSR